MNGESQNSGVRKKIRKDRTTYRIKTYTDKDPLCVNFRHSCSHLRKKTKFKCNSITMEDVVKNRQRLFKQTKKVEQDTYLTRLLGPAEPKRRRNAEPRRNTRNRSVSGNYYLLKFKGKKMQRVCRSFFMEVFSISRKRLQNLNKILIQGDIPKEKRGGDRKSIKTKNKKDSLRNFVNNLPASESLYNRRKSKRIYLSSDLNATKLRKYYDDTVSAELRISRTMFYEIFHKEYNISFKTPASPTSDVCGTRILLKNNIKSEQDPQKKQQLMVEKIIHSLRANAFYAMIREEVPDNISLCFDMEKVQPLPKTPIQDAYYSRQISIYKLCVVPLDSKNPTFFTWLETQSGRGSVEVGSALYAYLNEMEIPVSIKSLCLFCDGCGGQNKNSHIVHILMQWLLNKSPTNLKKIKQTFPVRGHSFLPADRVFGRLEKDIKKETVMTVPEAYYQIYRKHGSLKILGEDWSLYNIKELEKYYKKVADIQSLKRIIIKKSKRFGCNIYTHETFRYETSQEPTNLLKRGKRHCLSLERLNTTLQGISVHKKNDVNNLLVKQFGNNWVDLPELLFYKNIISDEQTTTTSNQHNNEGDEYCDCLEDDIGQIRI